jgi:catechol 2,3-dioxygenase-like lactoylglutathione lyase family enzyme
MNGEREASLRWPDHLVPGAVRLSYSSANYDATVAFYRDVVGLPLIAEFADSFGEDGTIFGLPSIQLHLEIVRSRKTGRDVDPLDQLVFYLSGPVAAAEASAPVQAAGTQRDPSPHPYWESRGATVYLDPDGRRVVFAPWVFGLEPEPNEHLHGSASSPEPR